MVCERLAGHQDAQTIAIYRAHRKCDRIDRDHHGPGDQCDKAKNSEGNDAQHREQWDISFFEMCQRSSVSGKIKLCASSGIAHARGLSSCSSHRCPSSKSTFVFMIAISLAFAFVRRVYISQSVRYQSTIKSRTGAVAVSSSACSLNHYKPVDCSLFAFDRQQLDVEDQGGIRWDIRAGAALPIGKVVRNEQLPLRSYRHEL